jgi:glycosyltransferase involved in cell wall biosynthesis
MTSNAASSLPFVSVIIPVYNDRERLCLCLEALEKQTYACDRYEVVVVDNASSEPVGAEVKRFPHASAEYESRPGSYAARNRGIAASRGEILAFTDADCIPSECWLEEGVAGLTTQCSTIIGGRIDVFPVNTAHPTAVELYEMAFAFPQHQTVKSGFSVTANLITKREVIDQVGEFEASFKSTGDKDWCIRAVNAGHKLAYCDRAVVMHPARRTLKEIHERHARFAGGHFDRSRSSRKEFNRARVAALLRIKPPVRFAYDVISQDKPAGAASKAKVIAVALFANWSYAIEWLRLELGAVSRR